MTQNFGTVMSLGLTGRSDISMQQSMGTADLSEALGGVSVNLNRFSSHDASISNPHDERPVGGGSGPSTLASTMERTAYQAYEERPINATG
mmetsp:Transcript_5968/g.8076  ORF Transcript_5968/g.8076 Transcript_5968/m.8076 type:complete len:91 (-) Transcript_5968:515-787(-)